MKRGMDAECGRQFQAVGIARVLVRDGEWAEPLVVKLLHWASRLDVVRIQPDLVTNVELHLGVTVSVAEACHV